MLRRWRLERRIDRAVRHRNERLLHLFALHVLGPNADQPYRPDDDVLVHWNGEIERLFRRNEGLRPWVRDRQGGA